MKPYEHKEGLSPEIVKHLKEIGVVPQYGWEEVDLIYATILEYQPDIICEWGTNIGYSARLFAELIQEIGIDCPVHSTDITESAAKGRRGEMAGPLVNLHVGEGLELSLRLTGDAKRPLFFLDDDHMFDHVRRQLYMIAEVEPGAVMLIHDVMKVEKVGGDSVWVAHEPHRAIMDFLSQHGGYEAVFVTNGSSMARLWPR